MKTALNIGLGISVFFMLLIIFHFGLYLFGEKTSNHNESLIGVAMGIMYLSLPSLITTGITIYNKSKLSVKNIYKYNFPTVFLIIAFSVVSII